MKPGFYLSGKSQTIGDFPNISAKSGTVGKQPIPDRLGFSQHLKTRLKMENAVNR